MKTRIWKTLLVCGLMTSIASADLFAQGGGRGGGGGRQGGGGGGRPGGGGGPPGGGGRPGGGPPGGGGPSFGGGRGGPPGVPGGGRGPGGGGNPGGARPGGNPGGGIPTAGPGRGPVGGRPSVSPPAGPQAGGRNNPPGNAPRSPSFTQPQFGNRSPFNQRDGIGNQRPDFNRGTSGPNEGRNRFPDANIVNRPGGINQRPGLNNPGRGDHIRNEHWRQGPWAGSNTINFNNRSINLANTGYRPAYVRHPQYRGYWNGNYGWGNNGWGNNGWNNNGFGRGFGSGLGFGLGYGLAGGLGGYRGYGGYGGYGWGGPGYGYGYGYRPLGWGLGSWGLGSLAYGSGYLGYTNPYYLPSYAPIGNYSYTQPIPVYYDVASTQVTAPVTGDTVVDNGNVAATQSPTGQSAAAGTTECERAFDEAVTAFKQNNYDAALDTINHGLAKCPDDSVMHEFRSLILFAKADYQQSASTIHSVLAVGPGWNWTTLSSLYSDVETYTTHLRALEAFTREHSQDAAAKFLLAYHYIVDGYPESAVPQLKQVVSLVPNDKVAADILRMVSKPEQPTTSEGVQQPTPQPPEGSEKNDGKPADPAVPPLDPNKLHGKWNASRDDGSQFEMTIEPENKFHWKYTQNGVVQEFDGTYTIDGNVIALERKDGGSLIAGIVPDGDNKFKFKLLGSPEEDPGLDFSR